MATNEASTSKMPKWSELQRFINKHKVEKGCEYTHTFLGNIPFSFYVPTDQNKLFFKLYEEAYISQSENLYITEKNRHIGPIVVDLDLRYFAEDPLQRTYTDDTVAEIVSIYVSVIKKYFQIKETDYIFVQEKKTPTVNTKGQGNQKDGIHIVMPSFVTRASVKYMIRNEVMKLCTEKKVFKNTVNSITDIVDEAIIERNSWYMYGSKKKNNEPYLLTRIFDMNCDEVELDVEDNELVTIFSIRNKNKERELSPTIKAVVKEYEDTKEEDKIKARMKKKILTTTNLNVTMCENIESIKKLVSFLNKNRAENYEDWIRLGWCLRNIDHRLDTVWEEFSTQSVKYKKGECLRLWNKMKPGGLTVATLRMWAKTDNPDQYNEFIKTDLSDLLYASRSKTHHDIAKVIHHMFQHQYVCSSAKGRDWYEFKNHRWIPVEGGISLRMKLSEDVWKVYKNEVDKFNRMSMNAASPADQDNFHETVKIYLDICTKLRTTTYKENVMKECAELFYVDKFEEKLDSDVSLICF